MSIIHRFVGTIDAPEPGANHVVGLVYSPTTIGFVTIPLKCFPPHQRGSIQQDDRIEGRGCPRSVRVWVTGHREARE